MGADENGGARAPGDLRQACETQVWLATARDAQALVSGRYFFHRAENRYNPSADEVAAQEQLLAICGKMTGISLPQ